MAKPLDGPSEVISALVDVLALYEDLFAWSHNQEHFFEHTEYCGLKKLFDRQVSEARDLRRPLLDRIFQLGGTVEGVEPAPDDSLKELMSKLAAIHAACQDAYESVESDEDYVTRELLTDSQKSIEKRIEKIRQFVTKKDLIGEQLWLDRLT